MSQQTTAASALPTLRPEPDLSKLEAGGGKGNTTPSNGETATAAATATGGRGGGEQEMYHLAEDDGGEEEGGPHWAPGGLRASLEKYRWAELIVLVVIVGLAYKGFHQGVKKDWMFIPQVTQLLPDGTSIVLGNATAFSYPIKFKDGQLECAPITLQNCGLNTELAAAEPCCAFMKTGEGPHQTVSVLMLAGLCVILPLLLLLLRHAFLQKYLYSSSSSSSSSSRMKNGLFPSSSSSSSFSSATHSLRDVLVGFLFSIALTQATTNSLKTFVSQPRPNHFALLLFASLSPPSYKTVHYEHSAWASWPSGHCSMSMTTGAFLSLVLLRDIKQFTGTTQRELRTILVLLALGPVFLALYIAGTRVHDYFHSAADAVTGMGLGLVWALVAFYHIVPANGLEVRPNKPLKYL